MASLSALGAQIGEAYSADGQRSREGSVLSPKQHYRLLSEAVTVALAERGINRPNLSVGIQEPKKIKPIYQIKEGKASLKAASILTCATLVGLASRVFGPSQAPRRLALSHTSYNLDKLAPRRLRSPTPRVTPLPPELSQTAKAGIAGALVVGIGAVGATAAYQHQGGKLRADILRTYNEIGDDGVNQLALLQSANEIMAKKEASYFNRIFEYYNPNPTSCLFLTKGIALDSQQDFVGAQAQYRKGLDYVTEPELRNILLFALARSLRLSDVDRNAILEQTVKIDVDSPIQELGLIEAQAAEVRSDEVFDEDDGIPYKFKCAITASVMVAPTFYQTADGRRFYFEGASIREWVTRSGTCPSTRAPLALDQLREDNRLAEAIQIWNQFKLKKDN